MGRKKTNFRETEFDEVAAYQQLLDFEEEWVRKPERNTLSEQPCPNNPVLPNFKSKIGTSIGISDNHSDLVKVRQPKSKHRATVRSSTTRRSASTAAYTSSGYSHSSQTRLLLLLLLLPQTRC